MSRIISEQVTAADSRKSLTVQPSTIARWKYDARILGIAIDTIGRYGVWEDSPCEGESPVVVVLGFSAGRHMDSSRSSRDCELAGKCLFISGNNSIPENGSHSIRPCAS